MVGSVARPRVGRPRAVENATPGAAPREQILLAASRLFVEYGVGATSTRAIAEAVGMRQASLYYHFAGKDEILAELLGRSIRSSVEIAREIPEVLTASEAAAALYRLARADAELLLETPHNIGALYLMPELGDERFDEFHAERDELRGCYGRLAAAARGIADAGAADDERTLLGHLVLQTVETVIQLRRAGHALPAPGLLAEAALRTAGLAAAAVARAAADHSASAPAS